jgi:Transposase DNA-binding/Transposase Tn5 dimerisation domain
MNAAAPPWQSDVWAAELAEQADLPDERLKQRLADILAVFARKSQDSIPQACDSPAATKATYRFFSNHRVGVERLHDAVAAQTAVRCRGLATVLAAHDTTSLNYSELTGTTGLGPIGSTGTARGLHLHSTLALRLDGVALGLLHQECWSRPPESRRDNHQQVSFEDKESLKWSLGVGGSELALDELPSAERPRVIHLMDREGDIHEVLEAIASTTDGCVVRCTHNRVIDGPIGHAHDAVTQAPLLGVHTIEGPARAGQPPRKAQLELRSVRVTVQPRRAHSVQADREPFSMHLVEAREVNAATNVTPLHWLLWTTEAARTLDEVIEVLRYYRQRWKIEDFHLILKSGCRIEELELETAERLTKAVVIYSAVAAHLLALRDLARVEPNAPCTTILSDDAWKALWLHTHQKPLPAKLKVPTIRQAVLWIGRLGGHLNRKRDGMPGVRTLWRGYRDLSLLVLGYRLARADSR